MKKLQDLSVDELKYILRKRGQQFLSTDSKAALSVQLKTLVDDSEYDFANGLLSSEVHASAPAQVIVQGGAPICNLQKFSGVNDSNDIDNISYEQWIQEFHATALLNSWTSDQKGSALYLYTSGPAQQIVREYFRSDSSGRLIIDFDGAKTALQEEFGIQESDCLFWSSKLVGIKQEEQSVSAYQRKLLEIAAKDYPQSSIPDRNQILLSIFVMGLKKDIRIAVLEKQCSTFDTAVQTARDRERVTELCQKLEHSSEDSSSDPTVNAAAASSISLDYQALKKEVQSLQQTVKSLQLQHQTHRPRCYVCRLPGHIARNCDYYHSSQYSGRGGSAPCTILQGFLSVAVAANLRVSHSLFVLPVLPLLSPLMNLGTVTIRIIVIAVVYPLMMPRRIHRVIHQTLFRLPISLTSRLPRLMLCLQILSHNLSRSRKTD